MEERYQHLVTDGYEFEMGRYVSEGWELFKKGAGSFIGFVLLYFIISMMIAMIPFVNFLASFIQQALVAGMFIFSRNLLNKKEEFGDFFSGFQYFGNIAGYLVIYILIIIPLVIVMFTAIFPFELLPEMIDSFSGTPNFDDMQYLFEDLAVSIMARIPIFILIWLAFMYITISYSFALPLIVDSKLGAWKAMETSRRVITKKFFSFFGMYILIGILASIGIVFTCGLGLLIVFPFMYCIVFSAYNDIFQPDAGMVTDQIDDFGKSEGDINTESEES